MDHENHMNPMQAQPPAVASMVPAQPGPQMQPQPQPLGGVRLLNREDGSIYEVPKEDVEEALANGFVMVDGEGERQTRVAGGFSQDPSVPRPSTPEELAANQQQQENQPMTDKVGDWFKQNFASGGAGDVRNMMAAVPGISGAAGFASKGASMAQPALRALGSKASQVLKNLSKRGAKGAKDTAKGLSKEEMQAAKSAAMKIERDAAFKAEVQRNLPRSLRDKSDSKSKKVLKHLMRNRGKYGAATGVGGTASGLYGAPKVGRWMKNEIGIGE